MRETVTIGEELERFRHRFLACNIVSLADLSTGIVLAASTRSETTQEALETLCDEALKVLAGQDMALLIRLFGAGDTSRPSTRLIVSSTDLKCFVAARPPHNEALCMVFGREASLVDAITVAADLLSRLAAEP